MQHVLHITSVNAVDGTYDVFAYEPNSGDQVNFAEGLSLADARMFVEADNMLRTLNQIAKIMDVPGTECPLPTEIASNVRILCFALNNRHKTTNHFSTLPMVEVQS